MMQPKDALGRFGLKGSKPLAKKVIGVRLPQEDYDQLMATHPNDYNDWIKQAIAKALDAEKNGETVN